MDLLLVNGYTVAWQYKIVVRMMTTAYGKTRLPTTLYCSNKRHLNLHR